MYLTFLDRCDKKVNKGAVMKTTIAILLLILLTAINQAWSAEKELDKILKEYVQDVLKYNPEYGQSEGITKKTGFDVDFGKLTIRNPDYITQMNEIDAKYYDRVKKVSDAGLSESEKLDKEIFLSEFPNRELNKKFRFYKFEVSQMFGDHSELIDNFTDKHSINSEADIKDLISKLQQIKLRFAELKKIIKLQEDLKIIPVKYIFKDVIKQVSVIANSTPEKNPVYTTTKGKIDKLSLPDSIKTKYNNKILGLTISELIPVYKDYSDYLTKLINQADTIAGVWKLPDGDKYYKFCLQKETGTDLTPDQVHELGLKEVARLQNQIVEIYKKKNIKGNNFVEMFRNLHKEIWKDTTNTSFFYEFSEKGKEAAFNDYQKIIDETYKILPDYFRIIPKASVIVKKVPDYMQGGSGAYYSSPPLDGSGEGVFYVDLSQGTPLKFGMYWLAYHEAVPGHHFQLALAQELASTKMYKHIFPFTEYTEGWATYAEMLASEENWTKDDYIQQDLLCRLLMKAARLVVDTGMHAKKWTIYEAYDYLIKNQGWASFQDLKRYSVDPAQACSYMIGALKIRELREKAKVQLGSKFDIREFHHAVLKNGAMPLSLLEKQIDKYIAENK